MKSENVIKTKAKVYIIHSNDCQEESKCLLVKKKKKNLKYAQQYKIILEMDLNKN